jgi:hypothetical protein
LLLLSVFNPPSNFFNIVHCKKLLNLFGLKKGKLIDENLPRCLLCVPLMTIALSG